MSDESKEPRGQGGMPLLDYVLKLEEAIENATIGDGVACVFCETEDFGKHIWGCVYAAIVDAPSSMMEHKKAQEARLLSDRLEQFSALPHDLQALAIAYAESLKLAVSYVQHTALGDSNNGN